MEEPTLKTKVAKGLMWGGLNSGAQQLLNLIFGIFLARILTPYDYGMVGVLTVFSASASILQEGGFISALTNRKNATQRDFSSVFWFTISVSIVLYITLYFCAPLIARFYNIPELTPLSRFIFLSFLISSINISPRAYLFKNLRVKDTARISILSLTISGIVGIIVSLCGFAFWGLAWQTVTYTSCITLFTFIFSRWHPTIEFSFRPVREMLGYSSKLIITYLFNTFNNNIFSVLLGKFYSPADVGDFNQANKWNALSSSTVSGMITSVAQPTFSMVSSEQERQLNIFYKMLRFTAFVSFPVMLGFSFIAKDFIVIAITEKWLYSASILQVLCVWGAFMPISLLFSNLILSHGRSSVYMWVTVSLSVCHMVAVYFSYPYGLFTMIYVFITINIIWIFVWFYYARKRLPMKLGMVIKGIMPYLLVSLVSFIPAYFVTCYINNIYLNLLVKVIMVAATYVGILWVLGSHILKESVNFIKSSIKRQKNI